MNIQSTGKSELAGALGVIIVALFAFLAVKYPAVRILLDEIAYPVAAIVTTYIFGHAYKRGEAIKAERDIQVNKDTNEVLKDNGGLR